MKLVAVQIINRALNEARPRHDPLVHLFAIHGNQLIRRDAPDPDANNVGQDREVRETFGSPVRARRARSPRRGHEDIRVLEGFSYYINRFRFSENEPLRNLDRHVAVVGLGEGECVRDSLKVLGEMAPLHTRAQVGASVFLSDFLDGGGFLSAVVRDKYRGIWRELLNLFDPELDEVR